MEGGVCDSCLNGFFLIWILQFIASFVMFIVISIAAALYAEFDIPSAQVNEIYNNCGDSYRSRPPYIAQTGPSSVETSQIELSEFDDEYKVSIDEPSAPPHRYVRCEEER